MNEWPNQIITTEDWRPIILYLWQQHRLGDQVTELVALPGDSAKTAGLNIVQTRSDHVTQDAITTALPRQPWRHRPPPQVNRPESAMCFQLRLPNLLSATNSIYGRTGDEDWADGVTDGEVR